MNSQFYDNGTRQSDRVAGYAAIAAYLLFLLLFALFVKFNIGDDFLKKNESGILINFGDETPGYGDIVTRESNVAKNVPPVAEKKESGKEEAQPDAIENDNADDAVVVAAKEAPKKAEKPKEVKKKPEPKKTTTVKKDVKAKPTPDADEKKPIVNTGALYKKKTGTTETNSSGDASHGATKGATGKTGSKEGEVGAPGAGGAGSNFSLSGRSLIGGLSKPQYDEVIEGKVTIEIKVDRDGKVTSATFQPKNSTISSRNIIEAAREAAMKTKFNADQKAAFTQIGTITYILKVE